MVCLQPLALEASSCYYCSLDIIHLWPVMIFHHTLNCVHQLNEDRWRFAVVIKALVTIIQTTCSTPGPVTRTNDCLRTGKPNHLHTQSTTKANSAFHLSGESNTGLLGWGWGGGWGAFTRLGWQVTLCDPTWQVTLRSSKMGSQHFCSLSFENAPVHDGSNDSPGETREVSQTGRHVVNWHILHSTLRRKL